MGDEDLICICMTVTRGEIKNAVREGHESIDSLKNTLLCCTGCGTCEPKVRAILEEELKAKAAHAQKTKSA